MSTNCDNSLSSKDLEQEYESVLQSPYISEAVKDSVRGMIVRERLGYKESLKVNPELQNKIRAKIETGQTGGANEWPTKPRETKASSDFVQYVAKLGQGVSANEAHNGQPHAKDEFRASEILRDAIKERLSRYEVRR